MNKDQNFYYYTEMHILITEMGIVLARKYSEDILYLWLTSEIPGSA